MSGRINRRDFLKAGLAVGGVAALAACGPTPTPTPIPPTPTKAEAPAPAPAATPTPVVAGPAPKITLWSNMITLTRPEGSDPERYAEVRDFIKSKINVECASYIPPAGAAGAEKLNLTLGSRTDELDIFSGAWDQYIDAVQPINKYLETQESARAKDIRQQGGIILPLDHDRSPRSDGGYTGWVILHDGTIFCVNYIVDDAPMAQIRGYWFDESDF